MSDEYPLILIPQQFEKYKAYQPSLEDFVSLYNLKLPAIPKLIYPPEKPSEIFQKKKTQIYLKKDAGCLSLLGLTSLLILFIIITFKKGWDSKFSLAVLCIELLFIPFNLGLKKKSVDAKHPSKSYAELLKRYELSLLEYQSFVAIYNSIKADYDLKLAALKNSYNEKYKEVKQDLYFKKLSPYSKPVSLLCSNRGKHDLFLADELKKLYPNNIYCDLVPSNHYSSYQPDIVYIDEETNLHVDIEIDEPYTLDKGEPIHFIDCQDGERNTHFLFENWVVIRFTEKQVVCDTERCCKLISSVVNHIKYGLPIENGVQKEKRWTYDDALIMSKEYYRYKYFKDPKYGLFE